MVSAMKPLKKPMRVEKFSLPCGDKMHGIKRRYYDNRDYVRPV